MKFFLSYCKEHRLVIGLFFAFSLIFAAAFALYCLPLAAVLYPTLLCLAASVVCAVMCGLRAWWKHKHLLRLQSLPENLTQALALYAGRDDRDYRAIIDCLQEKQRAMQTDANAARQDMLDYYTAWVHQIKTPIASMDLTLQNEDTALSRQLSEDLERIEQYVEMVLAYLRLGAESTDYVFRTCLLDELVRQAVRKFAGQFISRGLKLQYIPTGISVVTDEKWLVFVIEQVLSNALKYTPFGSISICLEAPATLCIRDTGIGIAPEDLPRIFEKGYTGYNGHSDKKASGLGLYLCRRVCDRLGHGISARSVVGEGTTIRLCLEQRPAQTE